MMDPPPLDISISVRAAIFAQPTAPLLLFSAGTAIFPVIHLRASFSFTGKHLTLLDTKLCRAPAAHQHVVT